MSSPRPLLAEKRLERGRKRGKRSKSDRRGCDRGDWAPAKAKRVARGSSGEQFSLLIPSLASQRSFWAIWAETALETMGQACVRFCLCCCLADEDNELRGLERVDVNWDHGSGPRAQNVAATQGVPASVSTPDGEAEAGDALIVDADDLAMVGSSPAKVKVREPIEMQVVTLGIMGSGRSSVINTLLNSGTACKVAGGQLRGTRGFQVVSGMKSQPIAGGTDVVIEFLDTEGLRSDQSTKVEELAVFLEGMAEGLSGFQEREVSHLLFSLDLEERQTAYSVGNLLGLCEVFRAQRKRSFLCLTKWNSNAVQGEWNRRLLEWTRSYKRNQSVIKEDPPSTGDMYADFRKYIDTSFEKMHEAAAKDKLLKLFEFFEDRIIWLYNLDSLEVEDREEDGELPLFKETLYFFYRERALNVLVKQCSSIGAVHVDEFEFIKARNENALVSFSQRLLMATPENSAVN